MREDQVVQRVRELAERVRITGRSLQLEPMNSYERRLVHNAFKDDPEVATWSPSDSARIKQITLLKRQAKKETAEQSDFVVAAVPSGGTDWEEDYSKLSVAARGWNYLKCQVLPDGRKTAMSESVFHCNFPAPDIAAQSKLHRPDKGRHCLA